MIETLFGAPSGNAQVSTLVYAPHSLGAPLLAMGGAQLRAERL